MTKEDFEEYLHTLKLIGFFIGLALLAFMLIPIFVLMSLFNLVFK